MAEKVKLVRCSHSQRPDGDPLKCGWTGRADKYEKHLAERHGGKEYVVPGPGPIPIEE